MEGKEENRRDAEVAFNRAVNCKTGDGQEG